MQIEAINNLQYRAQRTCQDEPPPTQQSSRLYQKRLVRPLESDEMQKWQNREMMQLRLCSEKVADKIEKCEKEQKKKFEGKPRQQINAELQEAINKEVAQISDNEQDDEIEIMNDTDLEKLKNKDDKLWKRIKYA